MITSTSFLFKDALIPPAHLIGKLFFANLVSDAAAMGGIIERSNLAWTIVKPTRLTDKPGTGKYRIGIERLPLFALSIARADVADCLLPTIEDDSTIRHRLGLTC